MDAQWLQLPKVAARVHKQAHSEQKSTTAKAVGIQKTRESEQKDLNEIFLN